MCQYLGRYTLKFERKDEYWHDQQPATDAEKTGHDTRKCAQYYIEKQSC